MLEIKSYEDSTRSQIDTSDTDVACTPTKQCSASGAKGTVGGSLHSKLTRLIPILFQVATMHSPLRQSVQGATSTQLNGKLHIVPLVSGYQFLTNPYMRYL